MIRRFSHWMICLSFAWTPLAAHALVVLDVAAFSPSTDVLKVAVSISGLGGGAPALSAYDLNLAFDAQYLHYSATQFGDPLLGDQLDVANLGGNPQAADSSVAGVVNLYEVSLDSAADLSGRQAPAFTLATMTFDVLQPSAARPILTINSLADANGNALAATTAVPLPAAAWLWLVGGAVLALLGAGRKIR